MSGKLLCLALVCNLLADARQASSDTCPNQPPPYVLLQTQAKQAHGNNMPAEYFEDPVSNAPQKQTATDVATAPFDVGSGSVRLPVGYKAATKVVGQQHQGHSAKETQAPMALVDVGAKHKKTKKKAEQAVEHFDEEDGDEEASGSEVEERQEFSGVAADADPQPTLLELQDAKQRLLDKQQQADDGAGEQAATTASSEQALVQQQAPAEAAKARVPGEQNIEAQPTTSTDQATSAADFFAAQGDFAGQEPGTPGPRRPQGSAKQIWSLPPHPGRQPEARPNAAHLPASQAASAPPAVPKVEPSAMIQQASRIGVASAASTKGTYPHLDILKDDGKPDSGQTGEEGEQVLAPATRRKFAFRNKNEGDLEQERQLRMQQQVIAQRQEDARQALNALKAKVYESASFANYRLEKQGGLQTDLRRAQLLADANEYKAHLAQKSRRKVEEQAGLERALHLSEEALAEEKDAIARAKREERKDIARTKKVFEDQARKLKLSRKKAEEESFDAIVKATQAILNADSEPDNDIDKKQAIPSSHIAQPKKKLPIVMRPAPPTEANPLLDDYVQRYGGLQASGWQAAQDSQAEMPLRTGADPFNGQQAASWQAASNFQDAALSRAQVAKLEQDRDVMKNEAEQALELAKLEQDRDMKKQAEQAFEASKLEQDRDMMKKQAEHVVEIAKQLLSSEKKTADQGVRQTLHGQNTMTQSSQFERFGPGHGQCTPSCTWQCTNPRCEQDCKPECEPPKCQTRCHRMDTKSCVMECVKPHCAVVCPKNLCSKPGCPACINTCSKPMCKLQCPNEQPCVNECEAPRCEFKCKAPESCPKPTCKMVCETARSCKGYVYHTLPPLQQNESLVQSFATPSSLRKRGDFGGSSLPEHGLAEVSHTSPMVDVPVLSMERSAEESPDLQPAWQPQQRTVSLPAF